MSMMCGHTNHFHFLIGNFFPLYVYTIVLKHCQTKNVLPSVQIQCFVLPAIYLSTAFFTFNLVIEQVKILHSSVKSSLRYQLLMKKYYYKGNIKCNSVKTNINFKRFFISDTICISKSVKTSRSPDFFYVFKNKTYSELRKQSISRKIRF